MRPSLRAWMVCGIAALALMAPAAAQADRDHDGVADPTDNCPDAANADQANLDGDSQGDACDPDVDGDYVPEKPSNPGGVEDNCPRVANPGQEDSNGDGIGDACQVTATTTSNPSDFGGTCVGPGCPGYVETSTTASSGAKGKSSGLPVLTVAGILVDAAVILLAALALRRGGRRF